MWCTTAALNMYALHEIHWGLWLSIKQQLYFKQPEPDFCFCILGIDSSFPSHMVPFKREKTNYNIKQTHTNSLREVFGISLTQVYINELTQGGPETYGALVGWCAGLDSTSMELHWHLVAACCYSIWISAAHVILSLHSSTTVTELFKLTAWTCLIYLLVIKCSEKGIFTQDIFEMSS